LASAGQAYYWEEAGSSAKDLASMELPLVHNKLLENNPRDQNKPLQNLWLDLFEHRSYHLNYNSHQNFHKQQYYYNLRFPIRQNLLHN
jgi:hypothetical protein